MTKLGVVLLATCLPLSATTLAQANLPANGDVKPDIKNAYSLGQVSASQIGIRSAYSNDQQNPYMLAAVSKLDQLIQRFTQNLGIDRQRVLNMLNKIDSKSPDANPLTSRAGLSIERDLKAHGLSGKACKGLRSRMENLCVLSNLRSGDEHARPTPRSCRELYGRVL